MTGELQSKIEMDKARAVLVSIALAIATVGCEHQPVKPIEVRGPLVDTPAKRWMPKSKLIVIPPATELDPVDPDLDNKLNKLNSSVRELDDRLRPNWGLLPGWSNDGK